MGGTGSGKTFFAMGVFHLMASNFAGFRGVVIRKTDSNLKRNTIPSYRKAMEALGANLNDVPIVDMVARYPNGSEILFTWANIEKDPESLNLKGLEATAIMFDELDQLAPQTYNTAKTRVGRNNKGLISMKTGKPVDIPPFFIAACNPNSSWVKLDFYDRHEDGTLPDNVFFIESVPQDNIENLGQEYIDMLETLPEEEKNRYLHGRWDYSDNPALLIQLGWLRNCEDRRYEEFELSGRITMAIDPSDDGSDNTVITLMKGDTVFAIHAWKALKAEVAADKGIELWKQYNMDNDYSVIVDAVGIGTSTASHMEKAGIKVARFKGGEKAESRSRLFTYKNKRAESYWLFREDVLNGDVRFYKENDFYTEITNIEYGSDDKCIILEKKTNIKKKIGRSPDYADSITMANYLRNGYCKPIEQKVAAYCF